MQRKDFVLDNELYGKAMFPAQIRGWRPTELIRIAISTGYWLQTRPHQPGEQDYFLFAGTAPLQLPQLVQAGDTPKRRVTVHLSDEVAAGVAEMAAEIAGDENAVVEWCLSCLLLIFDHELNKRIIHSVSLSGKVIRVKFFDE